MRSERACILMTWGSEKGAGQPNELIHQQAMASFHFTLFQVVLNISSNLYCIQVSLLCTIKCLYVICQDNVLTKEIIPAVYCGRKDALG